MWGGQRKMSGILPLCLIPLRQSLTKLGVSSELPASPPQHWGYRYTQPHLAFPVGLGVQTQVARLAQQSPP